MSIMADSRPESSAGAGNLAPVDDRDDRIFREFKADAWLSYAALADRGHMSASARRSSTC